MKQNVSSQMVEKTNKMALPPPMQQIVGKLEEIPSWNLNPIVLLSVLPMMVGKEMLLQTVEANFCRQHQPARSMEVGESCRHRFKHFWMHLKHNLLAMRVLPWAMEVCVHRLRRRLHLVEHRHHNCCHNNECFHLLRRWESRRKRSRSNLHRNKWTWTAVINQRRCRWELCQQLGRERFHLLHVHPIDNILCVPLGISYNLKSQFLLFAILTFH